MVQSTEQNIRTLVVAGRRGQWMDVTYEYIQLALFYFYSSSTVRNVLEGEELNFQ